MKFRGLLMGFTLILSLSVCSEEANKNWPLWQFFQTQFITESGRVNDPYGGNNITTSEGQSYALFFALVNNQPELFDQLLNWTEQHLSKGNLATNLPAWQWGKNRLGRGNVLDQNSASDSDLWILYCLYEASRLWGKPEYARLADQLAIAILQNEVYFVAEVGHFLLPGVSGFVNNKRSIKLNPSYVPMQLMDYFAFYLEDKRWRSLQQTSLLLTMESSPRGFAPDWIHYDLSTNSFNQASNGSYNAIRVYLWAGMLSDESEHWPMFKSHFAKSVGFVNKLQGVPESIDINMLAYNNIGNIGFDISFLPLVSRLEYPQLTQTIMAKIEKANLLNSNSYYQSVLALFGLGWAEKRFAFTDTGALTVSWKNEN
ncbi:cellulose synthase complex periplasmic endoglucanase BcsZ [uncultured Psychrosphaera sp.]|uniref:cellulose synthase complex periplasmic endoglucanase BcsZ n=1 Tax=uncultured Psychrosphaera sp. TaxID=1403522 RepID=UPI0030F74E0B